MSDTEPFAVEEYFGLKPRVLSEIKEVFRKHPYVEEVTIYGSRAKGTNRALMWIWC